MWLSPFIDFLLQIFDVKRRNSVFRNLSVIVVASLMVGCVSTATVKLDQADSKNMQGKNFVIATSDRPDFAAMTAGKAMFAMLGAIAMISAGNEIVRENDIEDPAAYIGAELAKKIAQDREMDVANVMAPSEDDSIEYLTAAHANYDYVLDVRTTNWSFGYFPTDWNSYRVIYGAKLRMIDVKSQEVVAEASCSRIPEQSAVSPSYDQLLNDGAARLKSELQTAAEYCVEELKTKLL